MSPLDRPNAPLFRLTVGLALTSIAIIPLNFLVFVTVSEWLTLVLVLAGAQFFTGFAATVCGILYYVRTKQSGEGRRGAAIALAIVGALAGLGGPAAMLLIAIASALGGAWGRPLRVRGRLLHPELRAGSDWTRGARPDVTALDTPTRAALEALWLHDAQKEHASVPAFARISWLLAAVGAPAELVEGAHRAAMEEIDHARRCFALAAGYGGRSHSVEPMPDLLLGGLDLRGDARVVLAVESLKDGCLLEDFNADVAAACVEACEDPATRDVLERITREERSHAEFSWELLGWLMAQSSVAGAVERAIGELASVPRPTAVSDAKAALVAKADPEAMRRHGRLPDEVWARIWRERLVATERRARALLANEVREAQLAA